MAFSSHHKRRIWMKRTKKFAVLCSLAVLGMGLVGAKRNEGVPKQESVPDGITLKGNESIHLSNPKFAKNPDGTYTETVHYTLQPSGIVGAKFYTTLAWVQGENNSYDWSSIDNSRNVEDYVTYKRNTTAQTISFTCKKEFGRERRFDRALEDDTSKNAAIFINYSRKRIEKASVSLTADRFTNGKPIIVKINKAKYSIGSTGDTKETEKIEIGYKGTPIADLLGNIQEPTSATSITYDGRIYSSAAEIRAAIAPVYEQYLKSCISSSDATSFNKETFKEKGKYSYTHFGARNAAANFITNYNAAAEKGTAGFYVKVTVAEEVIYDKIIKFSNDSDRLDSVTVDTTNVVF